MLKKIRVAISILMFALITFYFIDFAHLLDYGMIGWIAKSQLIPAIFAGNLAAVGIIIIATLLFGRIYCSSICPLGVFQDLAAWVSKRAAKKKKYTYSKGKNVMRYAVLAIVIAIVIIDLNEFMPFVGLVEPYSAYGRIAATIFRPVYMAGNNLLETIFAHFDNYTFYKVDIFVSSIAALATAIATFLLTGFLAWKYGRTYCNTVCPAGSILGFMNKFSLFKIRIDGNTCNSCGLCSANCKASCIDTSGDTASIDYSRCVACFNCLDACKREAVKFTPAKQKYMPDKVDNTPAISADKRVFLLTSAAAATAIPIAFAQHKTGADKKYYRTTPIAPPGARGIAGLANHCTSCHLCVAKCPSDVLKPAFMEYGIGGVMQPTMYFEKGYCNYNCTICSDVCPNGALKPLTLEQKHLTQVGHVVFNRDICVVHTEGYNCGACAEHCPTQAVTMVPYRDGITIPHVNTDICIGCGGCEYICPVRPHTAIYVQGNQVHRQAKPFEETEKHDTEIDDFGF